MKIEIVEAARRDLVDGYRFYEAREEGLGHYFLDSLMADVESLQVHAGVHATALLGLRRLLSKRFPFAVYYQFDRRVVRVVGVLHCRRDPRALSLALTSRTGRP